LIINFNYQIFNYVLKNNLSYINLTKFLQELIDEHAQGMVGRLLNKIFLTTEYLRDNVTKEQLLPALSVLGTVIFIVVAGYFMAYLV
jgi:hypothetical protein